MANQKQARNEKTGWLLVVLAVVFMVGWLAAIPFLRHSGFIFGLWRGLGLAPAAAGASGANMIAAARKARKASSVELEDS